MNSGEELSSCLCSGFVFFCSSLSPPPFCPPPCSPVLWQSSVVASVSPGSPDLFHIMLRYVNRASVDVLGRVVVLEGERSYSCANCEFCKQAASCQALVVIGG